MSRNKQIKSQRTNYGEIATETITIVEKDTGHSKSFRLGRLAGYTFSIAWGFQTEDGDGEYLEAELTDMQLFKFASEHGLLKQTTSGKRSVPKGAVARTHRVPQVALA